MRQAPEGVARAVNMLDAASSDELTFVSRFIVVDGVKYAQGENTAEIVERHAEKETALRAVTSKARIPQALAARARPSGSRTPGSCSNLNAATWTRSTPAWT